MKVRQVTPRYLPFLGGLEMHVKEVAPRLVKQGVGAAMPRFAFVIEQTVGHVTHYKNLHTYVDADPSVSATWYPIAYPLWVAEEHDKARGQSRDESTGAITLARRCAWLVLARAAAAHECDAWSAWASYRAWQALMRDRAASRYDALFFHTQSTTLLCSRLMQRVPSVISLDVTPRQFNTVGIAYGQQPSVPAIERFKDALYRRSFRAARAFITTSSWVRRSLVDDYGVDTTRITVIPWSINLDLWRQPAPQHTTGSMRVLFVGGDFARKGGENLLRAYSAASDPGYELHIVTKDAVDTAPGVHVYRDVMPNSDLLKSLYATADLFVLPTLGDCSPIAIQEAMAAGLPVIATDVGAIGEVVRDGETGILVPPGDIRALASALDTLANDPARRRAMGARGQIFAERNFDGGANTKRILDVMTRISDTRRHHREASVAVRAI